jgi:hypothetical protein
VTRKLHRRIADLESVVVAMAAVRGTGDDSELELKLAELMREVEAWHANPENQKWLAEQSPEYLPNAVCELREELAEVASGRRRGAVMP